MYMNIVKNNHLRYKHMKAVESIKKRNQEQPIKLKNNREDLSFRT